MYKSELPWPSGYELRISLKRSRVLILVKVIGGRQEGYPVQKMLTAPTKSQLTIGHRPSPVKTGSVRRRTALCTHQTPNIAFTFIGCVIAKIGAFSEWLRHPASLSFSDPNPNFFRVSSHLLTLTLTSLIINNNYWLVHFLSLWYSAVTFDAMPYFHCIDWRGPAGGSWWKKAWEPLT